ncbi:uncharacterized protein N7498_001777 [Penicillium cinerascens]|uniref:Uncharacterized protein n=1 Tax=Penicillium cinerascens TaxID=70096 RepID=A0A9W9N8T7_9EURO|nr:uncharacterized protein N7498_001777 [Penicillium cinerascens]KAJ5215370.1 hypothetical protein N7498_001777 [Penicillium cinerascens]
MDPGRNQYNPSDMGRSPGMGSNTHGSGPGFGNDTDTRGKYAGTTGSRNISAGAQDPILNNTASIGQPRSYGCDNHINSEDNYSSSMQEQNSRSQPCDDRMSSEDKHIRSAQEHKSHSATSHITPCQMNPNAEPGLDSRMGQQNFGGSATGGSSYNDNRSGIREPAGSQTPNYVDKLDPRVHDSNYQQNDVGNQRGGY